jgi:hypothetical protein
VGHLMRAGPNLRSARVRVRACMFDALELLEREWLWFEHDGVRIRPLQIETLEIVDDEEWDMFPDEDPPPLAQVFPALRAHTCLKQLILHDTPLDADAMSTLVDVALANQMTMLQIIQCDVTAESVGALARLIKDSRSLQELLVENTAAQEGGDAAVITGEGAAALAAALAANTTLELLQLGQLAFWDDLDAAAAVLRSVTGHPSLSRLALPEHELVGAAQAAAGAQLAAVIAANTPALTELHLTNVTLGDDGLGPLMDALQQNTHLRELCCPHVGMSEQFARDHFLPAIRANTSLRVLATGGRFDNEPDAVVEAELVVARAAADEAA